jgi:hypothetical protein
MSGTVDHLGWLERWYQEQCDGDWEHHSGVTIETLDNPGWLVKIDLRGVKPEAVVPGRTLAIVGEPPSDENGNEGGPIWMTCKIESGRFVGAGD